MKLQLILFTFLHSIVACPQTIDGAPKAVKAIDLDLPSRTLWATMNVGANAVEDYGLYYAWGEVDGYTSDTDDGRSFTWPGYKWCNGSDTTMSKYCLDSKYGVVDNKATLSLEDDAAHVCWGNGWRLPTFDEVRELFANTTLKWVVRKGCHGILLTSKINGKSIFLPAAGKRSGNDIEEFDQSCNYWTSSIGLVTSNFASFFRFKSPNGGYGDCVRCYGHTIRPVCKR